MIAFELTFSCIPKTCRKLQNLLNFTVEIRDDHLNRTITENCINSLNFSSKHVENWKAYGTSEMVKIPFA